MKSRWKMWDEVLTLIVLPLCFALSLGCAGAAQSIDDELNLGAGEGDSEATAQSRETERVEMLVVGMSQCPHYAKAMKKLLPVIEALGPSVKLSVEYIGSEEAGNLQSMHGHDEVLGNILQLCAHRHGTTQGWMGFLQCQSEQYRDIPESWQQCARQHQIDAQQLCSCVQGAEGRALLSKSFEVSRRLGASGSPTFFVDGEQYSGRRSEAAFSAALCERLGDHPACSQLPVPPAVPVTVLNDGRCPRAECDADSIEQGISAQLLGATFRHVDVRSPQGKQLKAAYDIDLLPVAIFGGELEQDSEALGRFRRLKRHGEGFLLALGRFDPVRGSWAPHPEVPVLFFEDARCETRECLGAGRFESFLGRQISNSRITSVDYDSDDGRALWKRAVAAFERWNETGEGRQSEPGLPMVLFGKAIEFEEEVYSRLKSRLVPVGDELAFTLGPWVPTSEICDNDTDDDGDRLIDCRDSDCRENMPCRPVKNRELRVFVMSQCPYGIQVVNAMDPILEHFGRDRRKIDFRLEFVGGVEDDGELSTMHGEGELEENLRQICAQHHYGKSYDFMDYVLCRNRTVRSNDWEQCVRAPVKAEVIRRCSEGEEGSRLLRASFELASSLGFRGSPSWLMNNRMEIKARDSESILSEYCAENQLPNCSKALAVPLAPPPVELPVAVSNLSYELPGCE